jgi:hypothetical protein
MLSRIAAVAGRVLWTRRAPKPKKTKQDIGYIILRACAGFASQPEFINAQQFLNLLFQNGVPAKNVRAFLPKTLDTPDSLSPHLGLPDLVIPTQYNDCIDDEIFGIKTRLAEAVNAFSSDPSIAGIALVCLCHGDDDGLKLPGRDKFEVADMVDMCTNVTKPFLVILDACNSTRFASNTRFGMVFWHPDVRVDVGFLTAGCQETYNSAFIISTKTENPVPLPSTRNVAFKRHHSMFSRSLLLELAYKLREGDATTLSNLPARMNVAGEEMKNGFEAAFQASSQAMSDMTVRFFFPWGPIGMKEMSLTDPNSPFRAAIPIQEIGGLFDDIVRFWDGRGSETEYQWGFVNVAIGEDRKLELRETGKLTMANPDHVPILELFNDSGAPDKQSDPEP